MIDLMAELRNEVYRYIFVDGGDHKQLQSLLTCKQIHSEAVGLAFAATDFSINSRWWKRNWSSHVYELRDKIDRLPATLRTLVTKLNIRTDYKLDAMAVLFEHGIRPSKSASMRPLSDHRTADHGHRITFRDIHDDREYFWDERNEIATFDVPSAGLFRANPNLRLIVFSWLSYLDSQDACAEANSMLHRICHNMDEHIEPDPYKDRPAVKMGHEYKFMTVLDEVTEHEWSVIFEPPEFDGV